MRISLEKNGRNQSWGGAHSRVMEKLNLHIELSSKDSVLTRGMKFDFSEVVFISIEIEGQSIPLIDTEGVVVASVEQKQVSQAFVSDVQGAISSTIPQYRRNNVDGRLLVVSAALVTLTPSRAGVSPGSVISTNSWV